MAMILGDTIRTARKARRMTLATLAGILGVSTPYLSDVEHNRRRLNEERIAKVAEVLDLDAGKLRAMAGLSRELADWIRENPELQELLRTARDTHRPVVIGGENCPCCGRRLP